MKTQAAVGTVEGNKLTFSGDYSIMGIMLWCLDRFEPNASGAFLIADSNGKIVPAEMFREMQETVRAALAKLEKQIL